MLSAESAIGAYPLESVEMMARIVGAAETHIATHPEAGPPRLPTESSLYHAVALASVSLAEKLNSGLILAFSTSGNTAVRIARERPVTHIAVASPFLAVRRKLSIVWGVQTLPSTETVDFESAINEAVDVISSRKVAAKGAAIVTVAGMPFGVAGTTNSLRVITL